MKKPDSHVLLKVYENRPVLLNRTGSHGFLSFPPPPFDPDLVAAVHSVFYSMFYYVVSSHVTSKLGRWILDPTSQDDFGWIHVF